MTIPVLQPAPPPPRRRKLGLILLALIPLIFFAIYFSFYLRTRAINHIFATYKQRGGFVQRGVLTHTQQALVWIRSTIAEIRGRDIDAARESGQDILTLKGAPLHQDELWVLAATFPFEVELPGTPLTPELIAILAKYPYPFQIALPDSNATDQSLAQLCDALATSPHNIGIELGHTTITNQGVKALKRIPHLVVIGLESPYIDGAALPDLDLPKLACLKLPGCNITDQDIPTFISQFKSNAALDLSRTKVTSQGIAELVKNKALGMLELNDLPVTDELLAKITRSFNMFSLARTQITDAGLASIAKAPRIHTLNLSGTRITNAGLKKLPLKGPNAHYFYVKLADTALDDDALPHLLKMSPFLELDLAGTKITDKTLQTLTPLSRPPTKILNIKRTNTTLPAIQALKSAHPRLHILTDQGTF